MNRQGERVDQTSEKQTSYRLDPAGHADVAPALCLELGDIGDRVGVDERAVPAELAAQGLADDVLAHRVDELPERVVGVHGGPELRPLLPELAADDDVSDAADRLAHQLALFGSSETREWSRAPWTRSTGATGLKSRDFASSTSGSVRSGGSGPRGSMRSKPTWTGDIVDRDSAPRGRSDRAALRTVPATSGR